MTITQLEIKLASLLAKQESEIVEFKEAKNTFDFGKLGKYFSALANEANLQQQSESWLIFGISDKKQVVGTQFRLNPVDLDSLKKEIASKTSANLTFLEIHKLQMLEGRVLLFQIPAAPRGLPIAWEGHYYGRNGEELSPLNIDEIERIRQQVTHIDWSAFMVLEATMDDLDEKAIAQARLNFKERNPHLSKDMAKWDTITFLNKAKLTIKGKITRTALLLLGKSESEHFLSPADAKIRWVLKNTDNCREVTKGFESQNKSYLYAKKSNDLENSIRLHRKIIVEI